MAVTVMHKRAFARGGTTMKKGTVASACVSLQGVPDIKGMKQKKALQLSPMGSPKGMMCREPKDSANQCVANQTSRFFNASKLHVPVVDGKTLDDGCGNLEATLYYQKDYRLYQEGFCPVTRDLEGNLTYDTNAKFYAYGKWKDGKKGKPATFDFAKDQDKPGTDDTFEELPCEDPDE